MTMDMGGPGIPGFGYGNQGNSGQDNLPHQVDQSPQQSFQQPPETKPEAANAEPQAGNGSVTQTEPASGDETFTEAQSDDHIEFSEEVVLDFSDSERVPGFETSASDCLNRALRIARSLNHTSLSSDHLMLALTMDPNARRLLERAGDIAQLRETAMKRLGKMHSRFSANVGGSLPWQTSDLVDIRKVAREAAAERDQMVAISDLVNAFPRLNGKLTYAASNQAMELSTRIEEGIGSRIAEAVSSIEAAVRDVTQRHQTVLSMLEDLRAKQSDLEQQRLAMEDMRRQVLEAADAQRSGFRELSDKLDTQFAELKKDTEPRRGYWTRLVFF